MLTSARFHFDPISGWPRLASGEIERSTYFLREYASSQSRRRIGFYAKDKQTLAQIQFRLHALRIQRSRTRLSGMLRSLFSDQRGE